MTAHHRHQSSLEGVDFSPPSLTPAEVTQAHQVFTQLITHCEPLQSKNPYKKVSLVRLTYEQSFSSVSFLQHFYIFLDDTKDQGPPTFARGLSRYAGFCSEATAEQKQEATRSIDSFAEYLFDNFFLPMQAAGAKTPQPSPAAISAPPLENAVGTPARLSILQRDSLIRDHNRCVVTRAFNMLEASERQEANPSCPKDDDDQPLVLEPGQLGILEAAHIIPHSMMSATNVNDQLQLSESKRTALAILNMFCPGAIDLIEGSNIDRPSNVLTLTHYVHRYFGEFKISFEAMDDSVHPHTYRIHASDSVASIAFNLPTTRTLLLSPNRTIGPPSAKLLALHRAIAVILHLSAAGQYIDKITRHMEELWARSDGSSELGHIVSLKLGGWFDDVAA